MKRKDTAESLMRADCNRIWQAIAQLSPCAVCGVTHRPGDFIRHISGHHEIGRGNRYYLHMLEVQVSLCVRHHTGSDLSPHGTKELWDSWMQVNRPEQVAQIEIYRQEEIELSQNNQVRQIPDLAELTVARDRLKAFLALGKPFVFGEEI